MCFAHGAILVATQQSGGKAWLQSEPERTAVHRSRVDWIRSGKLFIKNFHLTGSQDAS